MKRTILVVTAAMFIMGITCAFALAQEEELPLSASASSIYSPSYSADKAVDGNDMTYWIGSRYSAPYWIIFDVGGVKQISRINIQWYAPYYAPSDYDIQVSGDGTAWEDVFTGLAAAYQPEGEMIEVDAQARYIRLYIRQVRYMPVVREFQAFSQVNLPQLMRFQARLADAQEVSLEGAFTLTFKLYDAETAGTALWQETRQDVEVEQGLLDVELGSITALDLPFNQQYWLGVEVNSDGEMTPRFKLTTVPYSFSSE